MARKRTKPQKFEFKGFHNLEFTPEQRDSILEWITVFDESPADAIVVMVEGGYKVGIGYDDFHSTYQMALTCKDQASRYYGYCFTLRHDDIGKGLHILRYVYDSQLTKELLSIDEPVRRFDW